MNETLATRLSLPVSPGRDHYLGEPGAEITLLEYGSFQCPYCRGAHEVVANLRDRFGTRMRYVFRHRPITGNEQALRAAELAEFAHQTGERYWEAHDELMKRGETLQPGDLDDLAAAFNLPAREGEHAAAWQRAQAKVREDMDSAKSSGALYSPTFFIGNRRYEGAWDESTLTEAIHGSRKLREELRKSVEQCRDRKGVRVTEFDNPPPAA